MELQNTQEQEVNLVDNAVNPAAGATETHTAEPIKKSLREEISENLRVAKERQENPDDKTVSQKSNKESKNPLGMVDKEGRLQSAVSAGDNKDPSVKPIDAPISWKAEMKAKWAALPPDIQGEITRREKEMEKKISEVDGERHFGRTLKEVINPYTPLFAMSNATPESGIKEMLGYAQILQMGNPQQKGQLLWQLAQRWNADMKFTPQVATNPQNQIVLLQNELHKTQGELARLPQTLKQQQESDNIKNIIDAFAADPKNVHYDKVKPVMAALLSGGNAKDMQDAYEKACYADSEIRPLLLKAQQDAAEKDRIAKQKDKAASARNAGSSVKGSGGLNGHVQVNQPKRTLREELQANFRAATAH